MTSVCNLQQYNNNNSLISVISDPSVIILIEVVNLLHDRPLLHDIPEHYIFSHKCIRYHSIYNEFVSC